MIFKPFSEKYDFSNKSLRKDFPTYLHNSLTDWLWQILGNMNLVVIDDDITLFTNRKYVRSSFINLLQIEFREAFPQLWREFISFLFLDADRLCNFVAYCLQKFARKSDADELNNMLVTGGSAYGVICTISNATPSLRGGFDLIERVPRLIINQSSNALNADKLLTEAWLHCYGIKPDYEKVVSRTCDFLETFLGKIYFPKDPKPQLKKFIHSFENNPLILDYKGDSIVKPKSILTSLLKEASNIRGQHVGGNGRMPTREEAEFVMHTTIFIWNLHQ